MKKAGKKVGWFESVDRQTGKKLETVYIGSRKSEKFVRVYRKLDNEGKAYLRLEVEMKGKRSDVVAKKLSRAGDDSQKFIGGVILHEVQKMEDEALSLLFEPQLSMDAERVRVKVSKAPDKTKNWLIGQVLPAFERYINSHDSEGNVRQAFFDAIDRADRFC